MSPSSKTFVSIPEPEAAVAYPDRGARLPQFIGLKRDPGPVLESLSLAVVGTGSVGAAIAQHAARLGVGALRLIDRGFFKAESLLTQPVYPEDIGAPKASTVGRQCKKINPRIGVQVYDGPLQALPPAALLDADAVLLATDNLAAEVEAGQRCLHAGKPLLHASVHGDTLVAQVRYFRNGGPGACPACGFSAAEWDHLNRATAFRCEGARPDRPVERGSAIPTRSVSFLCSLAADLALTQLLRHALGLGAPLRDSLLQYCGYTHQALVVPLARNPECPCDHSPWEVRDAPRPLGDCTLAELTGRVCPDHTTASLAVEDWPFVEAAACARCGNTPPVRRFITPDQGPGPCPACGGPLSAQPFYSHRRVPATLLGDLLDRPLRTLCPAGPTGVLIRGNGPAVFFREKSGPTHNCTDVEA